MEEKLIPKEIEDKKQLLLKLFNNQIVNVIKSSVNQENIYDFDEEDVDFIRIKIKNGR